MGIYQGTVVSICWRDRDVISLKFFFDEIRKINKFSVFGQIFAEKKDEKCEKVLEMHFILTFLPLKKQIVKNCHGIEYIFKMNTYA